MRSSALPLTAVLSLWLLAAPAHAQDAPPPTAAAATCCTVPDGTFVELEIAEPISSKTAQRGQKFRIRLAEPLRLGTTELLPAGTEGIGEIVHADRSRGGGKPGELVLAARTLGTGTSELKLRGMKLGAAGRDNSVLAIATSAAIGPFSLFIHGGEIEIPAGTRAHAKLSGPYTVTQAGAIATPPADALPAASPPSPAGTGDVSAQSMP